MALHGNMIIPQAVCTCASNCVLHMAAGMKARDSKVDKMCVYL